MEGPTVIKLDGVYYLFYSANDYRSIDYAVGYATSNSPMGPWTKNENSPIIHRSIVGENGSGHGDIFTDKAGNYYYVYHVHASKTNVAPRKTRIIPLHMEKNESGIYDITVNGDEVIEPYQE
jgi:beta-xylosidase